jgi:hypothetical protein
MDNIFLKQAEIGEKELAQLPRPIAEKVVERIKD